MVSRCGVLCVYWAHTGHRGLTVVTACMAIEGILYKWCSSQSAAQRMSSGDLSEQYTVFLVVTGCKILPCYFASVRFQTEEILPVIKVDGEGLVICCFCIQPIHG